MEMSTTLGRSASERRLRARLPRAAALIPRQKKTATARTSRPRGQRNRPDPPPERAVDPVEPKRAAPEPRPWERPPPERDDDPWYAAWWVWTLAGAAVFGGAAYGGLVLLEEEPDSGKFDARVRW